MADQILRELGISEGVTLPLNALAVAAARDAWRAALIEHFQAHRGDLSQDSQDRLERNPLRILDSKEAQDRPIADGAPDIDAFLTDEAAAFFEKVTTGLDAAGGAWTRNARLVRGLDYYRHTAFEFVTDRLGAQGTVLGGGRYDGLIENLGGSPTPAVGWAAGIERLAMLCDISGRDFGLDVIIAVEDDRALGAATSAQARLRNAGISADMIATGPPRKRYDKAAKIDAKVLISFQHDGDQAKANIRSAPQSELQARVEALLNGISTV